MKCPHCGEEMKTRTITMQKKEYKRVLTILFVIGLIPLFVGITLVLISIAECNLNSQQLAVLFTSGRYLLSEKIFTVGAILTLSVIAIRLLQPYKTIHQHYFVCSQCKHYIEDNIEN